MPKLAQILGLSSGTRQVSLCVSVLFLFWSLYKTNGFHAAVSLFYNKSQRTSKYGKNILKKHFEVAHKPQASVPLENVLPYFFVICYPHRNMESIC